MKRVFQDITNVTKKNIKVTVYKSSHRKKLFKWLYEVTDDFGYSQVTFATSIIIIDRFTASCGLDITEYQLIGITSLFLAAKMEETYCKPLCDYVQVTDSACEPNAILNKEIDILKALNFDLYIKLPHYFLGLWFLEDRSDKYSVRERQEIFFAVFSYIMERNNCGNNMYWIYLEGVRETERILSGCEINSDLYFYLTHNSLIKSYFSQNKAV